jgi:peptidoglycan/LPS O-acetylase OafA/YrhL
LLPALLLALVGYVALFGYWEPVAWTLGYAANVGKIVGGDVGALSHAWSLAVEEHFYMVWPLVIGFARGWRLRLAVALLTVAISWRTWMTLTAEFGRVRFGSDTVAFALLGGCLLAILHHEGRLRTPSPGASVVAVGALFALSVLVPHRSETFLRTELLVVAISMFAVAGCLRPVRALEHPWLVWLGLTSYSLYLWHFLFIEFFEEPLTALIASLGVGWLSYHVLERPVRRRFHIPPVRADRSASVTRGEIHSS